MESHTEHYHHQQSGPPPPPIQNQQAQHPRQAHAAEQPYQQYQQQQHQQQSYQNSQYQQYQQSNQYQEPPSPSSGNPRPSQLNQSQHKPQSSHPSSKSRGFNFHSDHHRKNSHDKTNLVETHAEKESNRLHSKADPTLAISEAEPAEIAAMSETSLGSIRSIVHKDSTGNPIVDPDKSNPTRSRWERPLDTIRSFEAAIDGGYSRKSMIRGDSTSNANWNRRSSHNPGFQRPFRPDSFYGSRPVSMMRPEATPYDYNGAGTARNSVYEGNGYNGGHNVGGYGYANGRQRPPQKGYPEAPNQHSHGRDPNGYHLAHKDRSYETVTSAAASGNSDPAGYQTDPTSSDNSSIERQSPAKRRDPVNDYGIGFNHPQGGINPNLAAGLGPGSNANHPLPPPPVEASHQMRTNAIPRKEAPAPSLLRRQPTQQSATTEKRKSWFTRRFSKTS